MKLPNPRSDRDFGASVIKRPHLSVVCLLKNLAPPALPFAPLLRLFLRQQRRSEIMLRFSLLVNSFVSFILLR
ncbi:hypothetical protein [Cupriavidus sp. H19C3]|uniref:hypothetical protein n=1 Tax=Cupriavidus sp. H19C3 TaxID=3241603 RepID=UPI003BF79F12